MPGARILIIEDNDLNRQLVCDLLEYRGHRLFPVSSLAEARALWNEAKPDLILMDIHLPGESGFDGLREIRAQADQSDLVKVPIIAVTAFAMPGDRERCLRAGFDGYVSKPIDTRQFPHYIDTFLKER